MKRLALFLLLIPCAALAQTQSNNGFLSSTQCVAVPSSGLNSGSYSISGTWSGTITAFGVVGQGSAVSLGSQTGNGSFTATTTGYTLFEVCGNTVSSGAAFVQVFASVSVASGGTVPGSNCGDATHALGWTSPNFFCQAITATAAAGGSVNTIQWNNATALGGIVQWTTNGTTTITSGATGILDLHAAGTGGLLLPGALATGLVTVTTATGAVSITAPPANTTATASNFFTAYNSATGAFTKAQPACADLSNSTTLCTTTPAAGVAAFLATPSSANLATAVTDETGSGLLVFGTSPVFTTPNLGTPSALVLTSATGLPTAGLNANAVTSAKMYSGAGSRAIGWAFGDVATGSALTTSEVGYVTLPHNWATCTISGWHIMADAGTATIKTARVATGGTALPVIANSISTSGVALASGTLINSTTVTDFTSTTLTAGDTLGFFVTAVATAKQITFQLDCDQ